MRWLVVLMLAVPVIARADDSSLADARRAIDEIRYDDARRLLLEALKQGGHRPALLAEIYRLSAATAAVLGPPELAEQYYRRMLALAPDSALPSDASPRLREPFVAAQAYMAAQPRFEVRAERTSYGVTASIVDPLGMVVAVATLNRGELGDQRRYAGQPLVFTDVDGELVALDENGNFFAVVAIPEPRSVETPHTPVVRRWVTWAIPAAVFAGGTAYLFYDAHRAHERLDEIVASSPEHFLADAEQVRGRWRNETIAAWAGAGITAALTTTAIIMAVTRPRPTTIAPTVGGGHAGVMIDMRF